MSNTHPKKFLDRTVIVILLLMGGYQLWLVLDRWIAAFKYRVKFGNSLTSYVSLGRDTVLFGFVSLLAVCFLCLWMLKKSKDNQDVISQIASKFALGVALFAVVALLILVLLPSTMLR